jgi:hypothetical protein
MEFNIKKEMQRGEVPFDKLFSKINISIESKWQTRHDMLTPPLELPNPKDKEAHDPPSSLRDFIDIAFTPNGELLCFKLRNNILRLEFEKQKKEPQKLFNDVIYMINELNTALYERKQRVKKVAVK